jgi:predicted dehydrogenase
MRELLGMPKRVLYAAQREGGLFISAAFDYGDYICQFETGIDGVARFDCHLEVYGATQTLRVEYNTPYVRHLATRLNLISGAENSEIKLEIVQPAFEDNFTNEWRAFYESVTTLSPPKTSPADYRHDLEIFNSMLEHLQKP